MYISQKKILLYAFVSNVIYVFLFFLFMPKGITPQKLFISSFLAFSVIGVFIYCFKNRRLIREISRPAKTVFILLMLYVLIVIIRSFSIKIQDWVTNFGNVYMALAWFTPILIIVGQKIGNWKIVFEVIFFMFKLMLFSMLFLPFYIGGKLPTEWAWLIRTVNFVIIVGIQRFNVFYRLLALASIAIYIIIALETQQRVEFIYLFIILFLVFIDKLKQIKIKRRFLKFIIFSFLLLMFLVFTYGYDNINMLLNKLIEFKDTRTFLFTELLSELNSFEKIFGRGSLGTYHSNYFERIRDYYMRLGVEGWVADDPERITIEVGYLQMILKGGFLLLFFNLFLMIYACYLALFNSKNKFVRRLGLYILTISILSIISFRPAFTPTFIIFWVAIGTVLNKKNRLMNDSEVSEMIKIKF